MILNAFPQDTLDSGITLLWENEDTTADFDAQTIELDIANYRMLWIVLKQSTATDVISVFPIVNVPDIGSHALYCFGARTEWGRDVTVTSTSLIFSLAKTHQYANSAVSSTKKDAIPFRIYGGC